MKHWAVAPAAACAVMLVMSCATAPRAAVTARIPPLTIELYDSRAVLEVPGVEVSRLALPAVPPEPAPVSTAAAAPAPVEPAPLAASDASLRSPLRPSRAMSFQLAAPVIPPPAAAAAAKPAPARPAAPKPTTARPSPARTAPAVPVSPSAQQLAAASAAGSSAGSPAGVAGSSAAAGSAAASPAAAGANSGAASSAPYGRLREIYARQGDELQIGLDGVGFLWLGLADAQADGMAFKSKENRANRTLFTFQALKLGTYDLDFLQQDNMAGKTSRETVRVHVVTDQDFAAATNAQPGADSAGPDAASAQSGDPAFAQKLAAAGSYPAAVAELLKGYREGNPGLNDQIAALYLRMGSYDAAEKYWSRNLQPPSDFTARAVVGLFRVSVMQNDQAALLSYLRPFLALGDPSMEEPLVQAVRMEKARSEIGIALDLAGEYSRRFPDGTWRDEVDFLTAQLLEADSQFRDISRARQLYQAIVTDRPESPYADAARLRVQYIDRHFLQVR